MADSEFIIFQKIITGLELAKAGAKELRPLRIDQPWGKIEEKLQETINLMYDVYEDGKVLKQ